MAIGKRDKKTDELLREVPRGTMIGVVGQIDMRHIDDVIRPIEIAPKFVLSATETIYRTDVYDYGREGELVLRVKKQ